MAVQTAEWLEVIEREYLRRFIPAGGSSIKFAIGEAAVIAGLRDRLAAVAAGRELRFIAVDGAATRLHMIQDFYFALAREIDWQALAQRQVEVMFKDLGYQWPRPGEPVPLSEIAALNGVADTLVLNNVDQWLTRRVLHDTAMAHDFREAMTHLCRRRLEPEGPNASLPIIDWLRGDLRALGAVRPVPIGAKVTRQSARAMLGSLCHWLALAGCPGLVVTLDVSWIAERTPSAAGIRYTPASVLDAFEVLRQLVDQADRLEGLFLVVTAAPSLLDGEDVRRTFDAYPALKGRIGLDVQARMHDNPLAPLVRLTAAAGTVPVVGGSDMPFSAERVAIEALRAGVPNETAIRLLGTSEQAFCDGFVDDLRSLAKSAGRPPVIAGRIIAGGFGSGKSHLLGHLTEYAQHQHFIVSPISISKETPLFNLERVFAAAMRNAIVPDINDDVMSVAIARLDPKSREYDELETWASAPESGLSPIFSALLHVLPRQVLAPEDKVAIARFLGGARLGTGRVKQWLNAVGARKLFEMKPTKAAELAEQRLRFTPALFRAAGFSGWCVLLDEAELIGRYSTLQRGKSYAELARWLGLDATTAVPGLIAIAAIVDDFPARVLHERLDHEKIPIALEAKGLGQLIAPAETGMQAIDSRPHLLAPPAEHRLKRDLESVRGYYERSYAWPPPATPLGERRANKSMREYVKSWITDWDIQRLYRAKDVITTETIATDYTENTDLETAPAAEGEGDAA